MKLSRILLIVLALLLALPLLRAQDASQDQKSDTVEVKDKKGHGVTTVSPTPSGVPLKILVVISEFDGSRKVSSLPYTLYTMAVRPDQGRHSSKLRYNIRVPIGTPSNYSIQNVGTNIDCTAYEQDTNEYRLEFSVDRTWISVLGADEKIAMTRGLTSAEQSSVPALPPPVPSFGDDFTIVLKNGQNTEGVSAVDPVTGHVLKIDVTLTVLK